MWKCINVLKIKTPKGERALIYIFPLCKKNNFDWYKTYQFTPIHIYTYLWRHLWRCVLSERHAEAFNVVLLLKKHAVVCCLFWRWGEVGVSGGINRFCLLVQIVIISTICNIFIFEYTYFTIPNISVTNINITIHIL